MRRFKQGFRQPLKEGAKYHGIPGTACNSRQNIDPEAVADAVIFGIYNMSIFGIDELFLAEDMILFGESKVSINLQNGIKLIKESLKEYEKQIKDEYQLVLSNRFYGDKLQGFFEKLVERNRS